MKLKKVRITRAIAFLLLTLLLLTSCSQKETLNAHIVNVELSEFDTVLAFNNNIVYGYRFLEAGVCEFLTHDISSSKTLSHGKSKSFSVSTDSVALQDDTIYLSIASLSEENADEYQVYLYGFDNKSLCTTKLLYTSESPLSYLKTHGDSVLVSRADIENDLLITSINAFDVVHNQLDTLIFESTNKLSRNGTQTLAFDYSQTTNCFYTLVQDNTESKKLFLNAYAIQNNELLHSTEITSLSPDVTSQAISDFKVFGDYLYIKNFSDATCFAKLQGNTYQPLVNGDYEHQFIIESQNNIDSSMDDGIVFFLRGSPVIYFYTVESNSLNKMYLSDYDNIINIYRDDKKLLFSFTDSSNDICYDATSIDELRSKRRSDANIDTDIPVNSKDLY